ncbi:MAG: hypothetical protein DMF41_07070 [Verrucomicrobia bacterium]|nr:MAG: hypothetical protein DMF41_07070 [Verrucomicrobiota bacterium]
MTSIAKAVLGKRWTIIGDQARLGNTITVTEEKTTRAFIITQFTEITVNGQRATIADLKPGMTVNVTIGVDPSQAGRIIATGVGTDDKRKKKK